MSASRRSIPATALLEIAGEIAEATSLPARAHADPVADQEVAELIRRSADSNAALMRGDIDSYRAAITLTDDFTLMSPFGGTPTRGSDMTRERWEAMGLPEPAVSQCEASASGEHLSEVLQVAFVLPEACLLFLVVTFLLHQEVEFPLVSLATWFFPVWLPLFSIFY